MNDTRTGDNTAVGRSDSPSRAGGSWPGFRRLKPPAIQGEPRCGSGSPAQSPGWTHRTSASAANLSARRCISTQSLGWLHRTATSAANPSVRRCISTQRLGWLHRTSAGAANPSVRRGISMGSVGYGAQGCRTNQAEQVSSPAGGVHGAASPGGHPWAFCGPAPALFGPFFCHKNQVRGHPGSDKRPHAAPDSFHKHPRVRRLPNCHLVEAVRCRYITCHSFPRRLCHPCSHLA